MAAETAIADAQRRTELCDVVLAALVALTTIIGGTPQAESALVRLAPPACWRP